MLDSTGSTTLVCSNGRHHRCTGKVARASLGSRLVPCNCRSADCWHVAHKGLHHPLGVRRNYRSNDDQRESFGARCGICHRVETDGVTLVDVFAWETFSGSLGLICSGNCSKAVGSLRRRMDRWAATTLLDRARQYLAGDHSRPCICDDPYELQGDHDHVRGRFRNQWSARGTLCPADNTMLGKFEDSDERIERAIEMLGRRPVWTTPTGARW